jgi:hypothetical protein
VVEINGAREMSRENINISAEHSLDYFDLKKHKAWFDECSKLIDQTKQAKLQWLHDPSEINGYNVSNVRREAVDTSGIKDGKREYLRNKIIELATNSKNKKIRDLHRGIH